MSVHVRSLTSDGLVTLATWLVDARVGRIDEAVRRQLLMDDALSRPWLPKVEVNQRTLGTRSEAAKYLVSVLGIERLSEMPSDPGLWAWLCLYYFDELAPVVRGGGRKIGEAARWVPEGGAWRYYRHMLAGPVRIYLAFGMDADAAAVVLCGPVHTPGDIVGQLGANQRLVGTKGIVELATRLYYDPRTKRPRPNIAPNTKQPGTLRRFVDVFNQLDRTWDVTGAPADVLKGLLPDEFDHWLRG